MVDRRHINDRSVKRMTSRSRGVLRGRSWDSSILSVNKIISGWVKWQHCSSMVWGRNSSSSIRLMKGCGSRRVGNCNNRRTLFLFLPHLSIIYHLSSIIYHLSSIIYLSIYLSIYQLSIYHLPSIYYIIIIYLSWNYLTIIYLSSIFHLYIIYQSSIYHLSIIYLLIL